MTHLAEGQWLWRRLYVYGVSGGLWLLLDRMLARVEAARAGEAAHGLMALLALTLVLYLVAPTAQQLIAGLARLKAGEGR